MQTLADSKPEEWKTNLNPTITQRVQVVIVGAGLAGLAAAQRLYEFGIRDVIILEAQNRVGGRVHTISHSGNTIELGAQWLHGAHDNPLYAWLAEKDMLEHFEDSSVGFEGSFYGENGKILDRNFVDKVLNILTRFKIALFNDKSRNMVDSENSREPISQLLRRLLEEEIEMDEELKMRRKLVDEIFIWFLKFETIENGCDSMNDVSISSYSDWTDLGEGTLLNFRQGYGSLLQWFCSQIPAKEWIYLNQRVLSIEALSVANRECVSWLDGNGNEYSNPIIIRTNGTEKNSLEHFIGCHQVIVTVSLGVLKATHKTLFKPRLPESKCVLIENLGFGAVNKIVMQFEAPFWGQKNGFKLVWEECKSSVGKWPRWVLDILSFDVVRKHDNLLIGWIGGEGAKLMEEETDEQVGLVCLQLLESFLSGTDLKPSRLLACKCSRWNSNPDTRGSYSFQSIQSLGLNQDKLHEPIFNTDIDNHLESSLQLSSHVSACKRLGPVSSLRVPRIMFAGEATAGQLYSTTHGAIISGWREANRLLDQLAGNKVAIDMSKNACSI